LFIDDFRSLGDTRTHLERITPLNGNSIGYCPGSERGFQRQPLQTYTTNDIPVTAQFPATQVVAEPEIVEPDPEPFLTYDE